MDVSIAPSDSIKSVYIDAIYFIHLKIDHTTPYQWVLFLQDKEVETKDDIGLSQY